MPNIACPTCSLTFHVDLKVAGSFQHCPRCDTKINFVSPSQEAWVKLKLDAEEGASKAAPRESDHADQGNRARQIEKARADDPAGSQRNEDANREPVNQREATVEVPQSDLSQGGVDAQESVDDIVNTESVNAEFATHGGKEIKGDDVFDTECVDDVRESAFATSNSIPTETEELNEDNRLEPAPAPKPSAPVQTPEAASDDTQSGNSAPPDTKPDTKPAKLQVNARTKSWRDSDSMGSPKPNPARRSKRTVLTLLGIGLLAIGVFLPGYLSTVGDSNFSDMFARFGATAKSGADASSPAGSTGSADATSLQPADLNLFAKDDAGGGSNPVNSRRHYALLVGVRQYLPTELNNLTYTENDVTELASVLKTKGYDPRNIELMTQTNGATNTHLLPTAANIRKNLGLLLSDMHREDTVVVAFSGHGVQFKGDGEHYFCPADAVLKDRKTLVSLTDVYAQLEKCNAGSRVMLVDACRDNPLASFAKSSARIRLEPIVNRAPPVLEGGTAAFYSCSRSQQSFEAPELGHGVFFHYVIEGLAGAADRERDGTITMSELKAYTSRNVKDYVRSKLRQRQVPAFSIRGEVQGEILLVDAARGALPSVENRTPQADLKTPSPSPSPSPSPTAPQQADATPTNNPPSEDADWYDQAEYSIGDYGFTFRGRVIESVEPSSIAASAGLQKGDHVFSVNGKALKRPYELSSAMYGMRKGQTKELAIRRTDPTTNQIQVLRLNIPSAIDYVKPGRLRPSPGNTTAKTESSRPTTKASQTGPLGFSAKDLKVVSVSRTGAAARAGLKEGDLILKLNGQWMIDQNDLKRKLSNIKPTESVQLQISRENEFFDMVTLDVFINGRSRSASVAKPATTAKAAGVPGTSSRSKNLSFGFTAKDLRVGSVSANGAARRAGLQVGDLILKIDGQWLIDQSDLKRTLSKISPEGNVVLEVSREDENLVKRTHSITIDRNEK